MRKLVARLRRTARPEWALAVLSAIGVGCRATGATEPRARQCTSEPPPGPTLESPPPVAEVVSRLSLVGSVTTSRLKSELRKHVPTSLGRGEEDAGAPGRVTYAVERGPLQLSLAEDQLVVSTRVTAQISVCKPIGGFCVGYGRCSPELASSASVPLLLKPTYELGESRVSASVTRGCRIAGFDVSREVSRQAARAAAEAKSEIDRRRPELAPWVAEGWTLVAQPIALDAESCLRLAPKRIAQGRPKLEDGLLSMAAMVTGTIELERPCVAGAGPATPTAAPPLEIVESVDPESVLEVPFRLSWPEVGAALSRSLGVASGSPRVYSTRARGALVAGEPRVVVAIGVEAACKESWFSAEPWYDSGVRRVRLRHVRAVDGSQGGLSRRAVLAVAERIERDAWVPLPFDPSRAEGAIRQLVNDHLEPPAPGVSLEVELTSDTGRVLVDPSALVAVVGLRGHFAVRAGDPP